LIMVTIDKEKCIGCGKCVSDCVSRNLKIKDDKVSVITECIKCGHCVAICPCNAVSIPEYDMNDITKIDNIEEFTLNPTIFLNCIKARRSIRDYKQRKISQDDLKLLVDAGRYSATANNGQFHKYVFIQDNLDILKDMVWEYIKNLKSADRSTIPDYNSYKFFYNRKKANSDDDFLFRNAPVVALITSERLLDAGMAAQNIEMMATAMGMGVMFNGFLLRIINNNSDIKKWLGIENETVCACMLLGYPATKYVRTAPRKQAMAKFL